MPICIFSRATGLLVGGAMHQTLDHDPATHVALTLPAWPIERADRLNANADGIRAATAQEIADYDAAKANAAADRDFDGQKMVKAVAIWTAQKLSIPLATARAEIAAIYKAL